VDPANGLGVDGRVLLVAVLALAGQAWLLAGLDHCCSPGVLFLGSGSCVWRETA
jgi:hypothetical protein